MDSQINREYHLVARPVGHVKESDFQLIHAPIPVPGPGQAVARTLYLSLDPANRVWMNERASYMPPVKLGDVMRGFGMAQVVASNNPQLPVGAVVQGLTGWRDYLLVGDGAEQMMPVVSGLQIPLATMMGVLGITGLTAYFGLTEIGKPKAGETVVISAAAGATGSVAGQIAKQLGCRVVGIAGSDDKCAWLTQELGFDAATAFKEASRCLNCDVQTVFTKHTCIECDACVDICPMDCITFTSNGEEADLRTRLKAPARNQAQDLYVSGALKTGRVMVKDEDVCLHCGLCAERCPTGAWDMQKFLLNTTQAGPKCRDAKATRRAVEAV